MKRAMGRADIAVHQDGSLRIKRRIPIRCSICSCHVWFRPIHLMEPEAVPGPRLSWVLCKNCYQALLKEIQHSPVQSSLRLRIAIGLVASERWPLAYSTRVRDYISDRRWFVFIALSFLVAMLAHLVLIVLIASIHH